MWNEIATIAEGERQSTECSSVVTISILLSVSFITVRQHSPNVHMALAESVWIQYVARDFKYMCDIHTFFANTHIGHFYRTVGVMYRWWGDVTQRTHKHTRRTAYSLNTVSLSIYCWGIIAALKWRKPNWKCKTLTKIPKFETKICTRIYVPHFDLVFITFLPEKNYSNSTIVLCFTN